MRPCVVSTMRSSLARSAETRGAASPPKAGRSTRSTATSVNTAGSRARAQKNAASAASPVMLWFAAERNTTRESANGALDRPR